jgi:hypothetical protein
MTVAVSPGDTHGFWDAEVHQGICDPVSAIPIGGVLPITYAWEWVSGAVFSITPTTIAKDVTFTFTGATPRAGVYKVTATDKNGLKAQGSVNVYANQ